MLQNLHIENIAVVKQADIDFTDGFTVITGETGAGKSVVIDCLALISGEKISKDAVRYGEQQAVVEAVFCDLPSSVKKMLDEADIECDDQLIIRYTMDAVGKSVAKINGKSVTKTFMRQIGRRLVSVSGQEDGRALYDTEAYIPMLDSYIGEGELLLEYGEVYSEICSTRAKLQKLVMDDAAKARERDMLTFQIKDIDSKKLKIGEEEKLLEERLRLQNSEKIQKQVGFSYKALKGAEKGNAALLLSKSATALSGLSDVIPALNEYAERLTEMSYEIDDIAESVLEYLDDSGVDPTQRIDEIESRLEAISGLRRRYGDSIEAVLEFRKKARERLDELENIESLTGEYEEKIKSLESRAYELAAIITQKRVKAAAEASEKVLEVLNFLDMKGVQFEIKVTPATLNSYGADNVDFMIATNPGEELSRMEEIVSGGEMSRITLALRSVLNERDGIGCAVYDEIDTGISGKTSRKIGIKLKEISSAAQVISVTHSAQIATLADNHYLIHKENIDGRAQTKIKLLSYDERVEEAARILGGINITDAQRQAAVDMLKK